MNILKTISRIIYPKDYNTIKGYESKVAEMQRYVEYYNLINVPFDIVRTIDYDKCKSVINAFVSRSYILDKIYHVPTEESWNKFISEDTTDRNRYMKQVYDCDNFAMDLCYKSKRWLPGCSTGIIMDSNHAWTFIILQGDDGLFVRMIEPQNDLEYKKDFVNAMVVMW